MTLKDTYTVHTNHTDGTVTTEELERKERDARMTELQTLAHGMRNDVTVYALWIRDTEGDLIVTLYDSPLAMTFYEYELFAASLDEGAMVFKVERFNKWWWVETSPFDD